MRILLAIPICLALLGAPKTNAQQLAGGVDYADDNPVPCLNCGNPASDWRRYRNTVFNACIYGAGPVPYAIHQCKDMIDNHVFRNDTDWIRVCVEPGIEEVLEGPQIDFGCQPVYIKLTFDAGVRLDLPWIEFGEFTSGGVSGIIVRVVLPNGDSVDTAYAADQETVSTSPALVPYPAGHPWFGSTSETGPGNDNDDNDDTGGDTNPGSGPGGDCSGGNFNQVAP